jgi:peroxiredoxin Q/BCP
MTFVIDTDRKVLEVIKSETRMGVHGDRALEVLKERKAR